MQKSTFKVKKMSKADRSLLESIKNTYKSVFKVTEEPLLLKSTVEDVKFLFLKLGEKETSSNAPTESSFNKEHWRSQIGKDSKLRISCFEAISSICSYQSEHLEKRGKVTKNHRGDTSMLVLELIKTHLVNISKGNETTYPDICKPDSELNCIIIFLRRLIEMSDFFPQHANKKHSTRMEVFTSVKLQMEKLIKDLEMMQLASSSYLDLKMAIQNCDELFNLSIEFLHFLLRKSKMPQTVNISEMRSPTNTNEGIKHMSKQLIGQLMQSLLHSEVILLLRPDDEASGCLMHIEQNRRVAEKDSGILQAIFPMNEDEFSVLNPRVQLLYTKLLAHKNDPSKSGVQVGILDEAILKQVIFLHGLVEEFGASILSCKYFLENSKDFGDFGVYGILNEAAANVAFNTMYYIDKIKNIFEFLIVKLQDASRHHVSNKKAKAIQTWTLNFNQSQVCVDNFKRLSPDCMENLTRVYSKAKKGLTQEDFDKMLGRLTLSSVASERLQQRRDKDQKCTSRQHTPRRNTAPSVVSLSAQKSSYGQIGFSLNQDRGMQTDANARQRSSSQPSKNTSNPFGSRALDQSQDRPASSPYGYDQVLSSGRQIGHRSLSGYATNKVSLPAASSMRSQEEYPSSRDKKEKKKKDTSKGSQTSYSYQDQDSDDSHRDDQSSYDNGNNRK